MEKSNRIYTFFQNENLKNEVRKVVRVFKADKFFNYIDPNLVNLNTIECINLGSDSSGLTDYYQMLDIFKIDPFMNQLKYTCKQTFHFKELELSQVKMLHSSVRVGVMLNEERSKHFQVHNGMYRTIQINRKYCFVCVYGSDKKGFIFDVDFNSYTKQGHWFRTFEFALLDVVRKYLLDIENSKGNKKCPILREY
jgi:hypothetical protein